MERYAQEHTVRISSLAQPLVAGLVTALVGFTSSFAVVVAGLRAAGADQRQAASALLTLCLAMGGLALWYGLRHRQPISIAWSTPGAALLLSAGHQSGGYRAAVGAFAVTGLLIVATGLWGRLGRWVAAIPGPIASAMLAGVLLPLCLAPVHAAAALPALTLPAIAVWAVLLRYARRWATPAALLTAGISLAVERHPHLGHPAAPLPVVTIPSFSLGALVGIAVPLYLATMAAQNVPGVAVLRQYGYEPPLRPVLIGTGLATALGSVTGVYTVNLAAITAALAASPEAHPDPRRRWIASATAGGCYLLLGLGAGVATTLLAVSPPLLIEAIAGLALLAALGSSLAAATADPAHREAAVLTFAVSASGIAPLTIGAPFWALVVGLGFLALQRRRAPRPPTAVTERQTVATPVR